MKHKKIKQRLLLATAFTGLVVGVACVYVGNYFVNYALVRPEDNVVDKRSPSYEPPTGEPEVDTPEDIKVRNWKSEHPPVELELTSNDGLKLWASRYDNPESDLWVIAVHGYQSDHTSVEDYAYEYHTRGYNVLIPDLRAHGNSEGEYIGMGLHDSHDLRLWIDMIVSENAETKIVLHGQSMGAATVLITAGEETLPDNVVAIISDSGYTNGYEMMVEQLDYRFNLPAFPIIDLATLTARVRADYNLHDVSPINSLATAKLPILFIHGDADNFVLPYMHTELFNAYQGEKESLIVEGADHVDSRIVDPDLFYSTVFNFLGKHLPNH
ncbi:MAG: alpha/beta hydrolase [Eubacteriales bacterium]